MSFEPALAPSIALAAFAFEQLPRHLAALPLPGEANWQHQPLAMDNSFNQRPTLAVAVCSAGEPLATWKCNVVCTPDNCLIFSPLVIHWAPEAKRVHGQGRSLMEYIARALPTIARQAGHLGPVLLTSGNLTIERAGKPFFEALGWPIITSEHEAQSLFVFGRAAACVYRDLEALTAEHRTKDGSAVSFAYLAQN